MQRGGFSNSYELLKEFNIHHQEKRFVKRQREKMGLEQYDDGKHFYGAFLARLMLYLSWLSHFNGPDDHDLRPCEETES